MISRQLLQKFTKYVAMFYVFSFLVVTFYLSKMLSTIFQLLRWNDASIVGEQLPLTLLLSIIISGGFAIFFWKNRKTKVSVLETAEELYSVDWPNKEQTKEAVTITIVVSVVFSLMLAVMDAVWSALFKAIL